MLIFFIIICLLVVLNFFPIPADECSPTTTSPARPRPAARPPVASTTHDVLPGAADARTHHATSLRRPLPAWASALPLPPAPPGASKWNDDGSTDTQNDGTKWNLALRDGFCFDPLLRSSQCPSETANTSNVSPISTEWVSSESPPWPSSNVPTNTSTR